MHSQPKKARIKSYWWILFSLVFIFIISGTFASVYISSKWDSYVQNYLRENEVIPAHQLKIKSSQINLFSASISFDKIQIKPNQENPSSKEASLPYVINAEIDQLKIQLSTIFKMLSKNPIHASKIRLRNPSIIIKKAATKALTQAGPIGNSDINHLILNQLSIINGDIQILTPENHLFGGEIDNFQAKYIHLDDWLNWDQENQPKDIQFLLNKFYLKLHNQPYSLSIQKFKFQPNKDGLTLENFVIKPNKPLNYLFQEAQYQKSFYQIKIKTLKIPVFSSTFSTTQAKLDIPIIHIQGMDLLASKDKNYPIDTTMQKGLPYDIIEKLVFPLIIDTININESTIKYQEIPRDGNRFSPVDFKKCKLLITQIISPKIADRKNKSLEILFDAKLFGYGDTHIHLKSPYMDHGAFTVDGHLGHFDLKHLNASSKNSLHFEFTSGRVKSLYFNAKANHEDITGDLDFSYNDLNIEVLKRDNSKANRFKSKLAQVVLHRDNPKEGKEIKKVKFFYYRQPHKSFVNFLWKGILSGIRKTMGLPGETKDHEKNKRKHRKAS